MCNHTGTTQSDLYLTLKAPITTAADDEFCDIFSKMRYENRLLADDSHEIAYLFGYF